MLLWTVPGESYDRQRIPRVYLAGPGPRAADRLAVRIAHARWGMLALAAVGALFWATRR